MMKNKTLSYADLKWWQKAIGYEIYPLSFYDGNNDGYGDLKGITAKLNYLFELGVDLIWICPFFKSPMDDNGYDVSDYEKVNEIFGENKDFDELIDEAHKLGIRVIVDFVLNHTSDEHEWFSKAINDKNSKERNYYIIKQGKKENNALKPPNNWKGFFSTSAWENIEGTDEYYMHIFSKKMPDVNWENSKLQDEYIKIAKTLIDKGVDGFRLDAISHLAKEKKFMDSTFPSDENGLVYDTSKFSNRKEVYKYLKRLNKKVFSKHDIVTIGEAGGCLPAKESLKLVNYKNGPLNMAFNFDTCWENGAFFSEDKSDDEIFTRVSQMKKNFKRWYDEVHLKGWLPLYWVNHDHPRVLSQYGDIRYWKQSAKMLATTLLFLYGTPFLYNGEEIGMTNVKFETLEEIQDVSSQNYIKETKERLSEDIILRTLNRNSRAHARSVMQWSNDINAGFTKNVESNVYVNRNFKDINVHQQEKDQDSILNYYKKAIHLRKQDDIAKIVLTGELEFINLEDDNVFAYKHSIDKNNIVVISNFRDKKISFDFDYNVFDVLLHNYDRLIINNKKIELKPFESVVIKYYD